MVKIKKKIKKKQLKIQNTEMKDSNREPAVLQLRIKKVLQNIKLKVTQKRPY